MSFTSCIKMYQPIQWQDINWILCSCGWTGKYFSIQHVRRIIEEVTNDIYGAGEHTVTFESNELGQGTYFVKMTATDWSGTRSMNLVK